MADITAKTVNELRAKTGQPMMKCKEALAECGGDVDKAIEWFRKKGVKASILERATSEGRVGVAVSPDGSAGAIVEVNANTDFTAKSEVMADLLRSCLDALLRDPAANPAEQPDIKATITAAAQRTGENIHVGRSARLAAPAGGKVAAYRYTITGKIGVLMAFAGVPTDELVVDLGGHIAFSKPLGLDRASVPANIVAKEREIAVEQAKATGKPQQIAEKIAEGKLNAFFKERCLLDQDFFNSQKFSGTIADLLKQKGLKLEKYVRLEVGS
jgi:elongation factor Ts